MIMRKKFFFKKIVHPGIIYHGEVNESKKSQLLNKTSIVLLPSVYGEGLPMILLEAQLYCSVVITTKVSGCLDAISDEMIDFCCEYSVESILISIENALKLNNVSFLKITECSRDWVKNTHNKSVICNKYLEIFRQSSFIS